jgi:hypothetical protein
MSRSLLLPQAHYAYDSLLESATKYLQITGKRRADERTRILTY